MTDTELKVDTSPNNPAFPMPSTEDVQKYIRIAAYWVSGYLVGHGIADSSMAPVIIAGVTTASTFGWTLYGSRLIAKLNEIAKFKEVAAVQIKPAAAAERPELIANTATKIITGPHT